MTWADRKLIAAAGWRGFKDGFTGPFRVIAGDYWWAVLAWLVVVGVACWVVVLT